MSLFDPAEVPNDICSRDGVNFVNSVIDKLQEQRIECIRMPEPPERFRVSNMVRAYCQSHLWRCLELARSTEILRKSGHELSAMFMVRATYETVAAFLHFETKLSEAMKPLVNNDDLERVHDFIHGKTFATRLEGPLEKFGGGESAKATNILTQIDKMGEVYESARDDYNHLCEFAHPNALGGFLWFANHNNVDDTVAFAATGPDENSTLFWSIQGAYLLTHFFEAFQRIEEKLPTLTDLGNKKPD